MSKIGLIIIATGESYVKYAKDLIVSAHNFWPEAAPIVFTDNPCAFVGGAHRIFYKEPVGYPKETLYRYHTMLSQKEFLSTFDFLFYADADMEFVSKPGVITSRGCLTGTLHPGFFGKKGTCETRPESEAYCTYNERYYCGGFQGGDAKEYLIAAETISRRINKDAANNITAVWHDESHWNKYLAGANDDWLLTLTPSYCFPEGYENGYGWDKEVFPPILVALDKRKRGNHPRYPKSISVDLEDYQ